MAIALRTPGAEATSFGGSQTVALSAGSAIGDVVYVFAYGFTTGVTGMGLPANYTQVATRTTGGTSAAIYKKVLTAADTTAVFTVPASNTVRFFAVNVSGVDATTQEDVAVVGLTATPTTTLAMTSAFAVTAGALSMIFTGSQANVASTTSATGYTAQKDTNYGHLLTKALSAYGTEGPTTVTYSATQGSVGTLAFRLTVRPSGGVQYQLPPSTATAPAAGYAGGRHLLVAGSWVPERKLPVSAAQGRGHRGVNLLSRCKHPQIIGDGTYNDYTSRNRHVVLGPGGYDFAFTFANYYGSEQLGGEDATWRVGVEVVHPSTPTNQATSRYYPLTFGGKRDLVLSPGAVADNDPLSIDLPAAAVIFTRVRVTSTGGLIPLHGYPDSTVDEGVVINAGADLTTSGTIPAGLTLTGGGTPTAIGQRKVAPVSCRATPRGRAATPFVGLIGDSITDGVGRSSPFGYAEQILELAAIPYVCLGMSGESANGWSGAGGSQVGSGHQFRARLLEGITDMWAAYGRNDISSNATLASAQASLILNWRSGSDRGARVWQPTVTPRSTSTDGWITTANQTVSTSAQNTVRVNLNNWLRDGAPLNPTTFAPLAVGTSASSTCVRAAYYASGVLSVAASGGVDGTNYPGYGHPMYNGGAVEIADAVESARDSGLWKPTAMTADGLHPGDSGHNLMAAAVPTGAFTARP